MQTPQPKPEPKPKQKHLHRIKIIRGHLQSIQKMIVDDEYCVDIVHQSRAVQKALRKLDASIIEEHLSTCVVDQINKKQEEKTISELMQLFDFKTK